LTITGARACRFDVLYYTQDMLNMRMETILVAVGANDAITWNAVRTSDIGDTSSITPVMSTDNASIELGFTITAGEWMFTVTAYPTSLPGNSPSYATLAI